jgi:hypothetical protein
MFPAKRSASALLFFFPSCFLSAAAPLSSFLSVLAVHFAKEKSMSAEAARRAPIMSLSELVRLYRLHAGDFGRPVALSAFPLSSAEIEHLFSAYDEDYHISRFFHFSESTGRKFTINGFSATHVSLDSEIQSIL